MNDKAIKQLRDELEKREKYWQDRLCAVIVNAGWWNGRAANNAAKQESRIAELEAQLARSEEAYELVNKDCQNLTEKVIPNIKAQLEAWEKRFPTLAAIKGGDDE